MKTPSAFVLRLIAAAMLALGAWAPERPQPPEGQVPDQLQPLRQQLRRLGPAPGRTPASRCPASSGKTR